MVVQAVLAAKCGSMVVGRRVRAGLALALGALVLRGLVLRYRRRKLREKMRRKKEETMERKAALEQKLLEGGELMTAARRDIMAMEVTALLASLQSGALTPSTVLQAYQAKALTVDKSAILPPFS